MPDLDRWLADPVLRTRHRAEAPVSPQRLWEAAGEVALSDSPHLAHLVRWRIPGLAHDLTYHELFRSRPFALLDEGEFYALSGLCGRIWTLRRDYAALDEPDDFLAWDGRGTVRVLLAHWAEETPDGAALVSEVRVDTVDHRARLGLRLVRPLIAATEHLIGTEPLAIACAAAVDSARTRTSPARR
jgi:hypothetical protein